MNEYLLLGENELLAEIEEQRVEFALLEKELPPGDDQEAEARLIEPGRRSPTMPTSSTFMALKRRPDAALAELNELEEGVTGPVAELQEHQAEEVMEARAAPLRAQSARR